MNIRFTATETVKIAVEEQSVPIHHYLRQPERLVKAIANPNLIQQLTKERYKLKMRPIDFMMYHFQPVVTLRVWTDADGTVHVKSENCQIQGIEYINERFSLSVKGRLSPCQSNGTTHLKGKADVIVKVELPPPLQLTPKQLLESAGNRLLKSVLLRIKQRLLSQLLKDYRQWANSNTQQKAASQSSVFSAAENLTI